MRFRARRRFVTDRGKQRNPRSQPRPHFLGKNFKGYFDRSNLYFRVHSHLVLWLELEQPALYFVAFICEELRLVQFRSVLTLHGWRSFSTVLELRINSIRQAQNEAKPSFSRGVTRAYASFIAIKPEEITVTYLTTNTYGKTS